MQVQYCGIARRNDSAHQHRRAAKSAEHAIETHDDVVMEPEAEPEPDFTDADGKPKDKEKKAPLKRSGVRKQALCHV